MAERDLVTVAAKVVLAAVRLRQTVRTDFHELFKIILVTWTQSEKCTEKMRAAITYELETRKTLAERIGPKEFLCVTGSSIRMFNTLSVLLTLFFVS